MSGRFSSSVPGQSSLYDMVHTAGSTLQHRQVIKSAPAEAPANRQRLRFGSCRCRTAAAPET